MRVPAPAALITAAAFLAAIAGGSVSPTRASGHPELHVAAASDLRFALSELAAAFEPRYAVRVRLTFASSGALAAQIAQGAPFDLFLSANQSFVHRLAAAGHIDPASVSTYGFGRIVLWVGRDSPLDIARGLPVLTGERVRFVAIANPQHAPYGEAAVQALRAAGLYGRVAPRLVLGEDVGQALQFVQTGNADAGMIALALVRAPTVRTAGRAWLIPASLHRPLRQMAGVVAASRQRTLARTFIDYLGSPPGRAVLRRYGFALPGESD